MRPTRNRPTATLILGLAIAFGALHSPARAEESAADAVARARALLWKDNDQALGILEDAAGRHPGDADLWVELAYAYRQVGRSEALAGWAVRTALARFPGEPRLYIQKALLHRWSTDPDAIAAMGKVPGWEARARDFAELHRLGLSLPEDGVLGNPWYTEPHWWQALLDEGRTTRALEVVEEGLRRRPEVAEVRARRALTLALLGRHEEALREQEASGWRQVQGGRFACIADAWTVLGKPDLALRSFGGAVPPKNRPRMVYALLLARSGDLDGALGLLDQGREEEFLLRLGLLCEAGWEGRARAIQDEVLRHVGMQIGSNWCWSVGPDWGCLEGPLSRAIRWLLSRPETGKYPSPHDLRVSVEADWPAGIRERHALERRLRDRHPPIEELLPILRRLDKLRDPPPDRFRWYRLAEGRALADAGRPEEGLPLMAEVVLGPKDPQSLQDTRLDTAAEIGRIRSRGSWDALADAEPMGFVAVRRALARIQAVREDELLRTGRSAPALDPEIAALASRGPGILRLVLEAYPWRSVGAEGNRAALLEVLGRVGGPGEVPFLLVDLQDMERRRAEGKSFQGTLAEEAAVAVEKCLARITGFPPTARDRAARREAWTAWWWEHARQILVAK